MTKKKKILLVDDDDAVIAYLSIKLARNYEVISTSEPLRAVVMAKRELPDLILSDIDMPEMSGGDLASALAEDSVTAAIPLLYLTNLVSPEETKELGGMVGGRPGIAKRAPLADLMNRIEQMTT